MPTAWDGYARVDYLPAPGRLQVTLHTVEPTVHRRLRDGLACAFAVDGRAGPPTYVEIDVGDGLTYDTRVLLAGPLLDIAVDLVGDGPASRETRLPPAQVAALARRWAPYRDFVLAPAPAPVRSGSWADGLWAVFGGLGLVRALRAFVPPPEPAHRGDEVAAEEHWEWLELPADLAAAAGVDRRVGWAPYRDVALDGTAETGFMIMAVPAPVARLLVGLDDGSGRWVAFAPDPETPGQVFADLPCGPDVAEPALRFRTEEEGR
ncbi:hypothetical protein GCM10022243_34380 [Saccharothrix violaceirubra]|uniref:Uncharacterized protein n=1 Tax=Saccharothrix violaceirubra TaxID=413306 RepID=A0A7W7T4N1_9PSEU|nr:hypothetical protein [Saccharothrix violaceirubra]MBB4966489.1 hypothetical protein [Saccharothrix violaceirubra]